MAQNFIRALRKSTARKLWKIVEEDNIGFTRDKALFFDAGAVVSYDDSEDEDLVNTFQTAWEKKEKKELQVALKANKARAEHYMAKRKGDTKKAQTKRGMAGKKTRAKVPEGGTKSCGRHQVNESEEEVTSTSSEDSFVAGDDELDEDEEESGARASRSTKRTRDPDEVSDGVEDLEDMTGWAKRRKRVRRVDADETAGDTEMVEVDGVGGRGLRGVSDDVARRQILLETLRATRMDLPAAAAKAARQRTQQSQPPSQEPAHPPIQPPFPHDRSQDRHSVSEGAFSHRLEANGKAGAKGRRAGRS